MYFVGGRPYNNIGQYNKYWPTFLRMFILIFQEGSLTNAGYEEESTEETLREEEQAKNLLNLHPVMFHHVKEPNGVPNRNDLMSVMYINFDPNGWPTKRQGNHHLVKKDLSA